MLWIGHRPIVRPPNIQGRNKPQNTRAFSHSPKTIRTFDHAVQDYTYVLYVRVQCRRHTEFCLLGYNAVLSVESHPTFRRNMSPPSLGSKNNEGETSVKQVSNRALLATCCSTETSDDINGLHGVISQKIGLFVIAAVRTSNPTKSI
jgi:hypothetical protein